MLSIEAGLRGAGIAILLLLALFVWRDAWRAAAARYYALFMLSGICYLAESAPGLMTIEAPWLVPLKFLSSVSPALFQLWVWAAFDDAFQPSWLAWLPTAAMAVLVGWAMTVHQWLPWRLAQGAALLFVCVGLWQVLVGRQADLVEGRRRLRLMLTIGVGFLIAGLTIHAAIVNPSLRLQSSFVTAALVLAFALLSAVLQLGLRGGPDLALVPVGDAAPGPATPTPVAIDPEERGLLDRLQRLMTEDRVYREEGLGIAALAARLGLPEYRLRRLINQRLGYRNFNVFLNNHRIEEAKAALADPAQVEVPVITIAMDAGFQSLGPFNRAFKATTGVTPTEYRRLKATAA
jgi:AraC-like DNA-binding protein